MGFLIGLDGGGTKTAGLLCDANWRVLARARTDGTAILGMPPPAVCAKLHALIERLCDEAGVARIDLAHLTLGLSGIDFDDEIPEQHRIFSERLAVPPDRLALVNDGVAALWGVSMSERLALVQHGTAMAGAYRTALGAEKPFDAVGVAWPYDLRDEAFALTARMIDGRAERTGLADRVLAHCGVSERAFTEWTFRRREAARAARQGVAGVVFDAWRDGDPAAARIVEAAAHDYVLTARAMGRRMQERAFDVAFGGGVVARGGQALLDLLDRTLAEICPVARLTGVALPPDAGAVVLGAHRLGRNAGAAFEALERQRP